MIEDALAGKIDLILTKSVSRFARNTVDSLTNIRKLKDKGVECYFEKENIWTFDGKGELLLTIMSSLAQEESRSISENTRWGLRRRFAEGKVVIPYGIFLGYDKGPDGKMVINEEQAKVVRKIYSWFLCGYSSFFIAKMLMAEGIKAPGGGDKWYDETIDSILTNEKYKGDALLQKGYRIDFLHKKLIKNKGEVPQYYVENDHEPIVSSEVFSAVQAELKKRKQGKKMVIRKRIYSAKVVCSCCGAYFGSQVWHSTDPAHRKRMYRCNQIYKNPIKCTTPSMSEEHMQTAFLRALNTFVEDKQEVLANLELAKAALGDTEQLNNKLLKLNKEQAKLVDEIQAVVNASGRMYADRAKHITKYNALTEMYKKMQEEAKALEEELATKVIKKHALQMTIDELSKIEGAITEFDEALWGALLDHMTVYTREKIVVTFRGGLEVEVSGVVKKK